MKRLKIFGVAVCVAVLSSCTTTGGEKQKVGNMLGDTTGQNGRACVKLSDIEGYGVLQDNVLSIDGQGEHYLATLMPGCDEVTGTARIRFSGDFGEVCGQAMDEVVVDDEHCTINHVYEFEDRDEAMDAYNDVLEMREEMNEG